MEKEILDKYLKAGKILKETQEFARKEIITGAKLLEAAEKIEAFIEKNGGKPAFPINLSVNNEAAHYTPAVNDERILHEDDIIKVDIGVHVDGYIADASFSLNPSGKWKELIRVNEKALEEALKVVEPEGEIWKVGEAIEKTIKEAGFNVVQNLTGHGLGHYIQHAPPSIPNVAKKDSRRFEEDFAYAVEPFATNGKGFIHEAAQSEIFSEAEPKPVRDLNARKIMEFIMKEYNGLPFAERWIAKELKMSEFQRKIAMKELLQKKCIEAHPILKEIEGSVVSQAENCFVITDGKVIVLV